MIRSKLRCLITVGVAVAAVFANAVPSAMSQRKRPATRTSVCGNPKLPCKTSATFPPNDLPFRVPQNAVIIDTVPFYAIILKSTTVENDSCEVFIPESDRLAAQALFPENKVFTSRCVDPENLFYLDLSSRQIRNMSETHRIMAVYAGATLAAAKRLLEIVKATGKFPGANIRRMRTGFNGT